MQKNIILSQYTDIFGQLSMEKDGICSQMCYSVMRKGHALVVLSND